MDAEWLALSLAGRSNLTRFLEAPTQHNTAQPAAAAVVADTSRLCDVDNSRHYQPKEATSLTLPFSHSFTLSAFSGVFFTLLPSFPPVVSRCRVCERYLVHSRTAH